MPSRSLDGKVAIVTGAGGGIGKAVATSLVREGVQVVLVGRQNGKVKALAQILGSLAYAEEVDTDLYPAAAKYVSMNTVSRYGKVDIVINGAAVLLPDRPLLHQFRDGNYINSAWMLGIHTPFQFAYALSNDCTSRETVGDLVNISSLAAVMPAPMQGVYGMFKAAMLSATRTLAAEMEIQRKKNKMACLRVFGVLPGITDTQMAAPLTQGPKAEKIKQTLPNNRFNTPEDVANAVLLCLKCGTNGDIVSVNGGEITGLKSY